MNNLIQIPGAIQSTIERLPGEKEVINLIANRLCHKDGRVTALRNEIFHTLVEDDISGSITRLSSLPKIALGYGTDHNPDASVLTWLNENEEDEKVELPKFLGEDLSLVTLQPEDLERFGITDQLREWIYARGENDLSHGWLHIEHVLKMLKVCSESEQFSHLDFNQAGLITGLHDIFTMGGKPNGSLSNILHFLGDGNISAIMASKNLFNDKIFGDTALQDKLQILVGIWTHSKKFGKFYNRGVISDSARLIHDLDELGNPSLFRICSIVNGLTDELINLNESKQAGNPNFEEEAEYFANRFSIIYYFFINNTISEGTRLNFSDIEGFEQYYSHSQGNAEVFMDKVMKLINTSEQN